MIRRMLDSDTSHMSALGVRRALLQIEADTVLAEVRLRDLTPEDYCLPWTLARSSDRLHALTHPASGAPWNPTFDSATKRSTPRTHVVSRQLPWRTPQPEEHPFSVQRDCHSGPGTSQSPARATNAAFEAVTGEVGGPS